MNTIYLLQNQHKRLLNKRGEWIDGREASTLFRTPHRDEALNQMIEVNARDYTLRIRILECTLNERGIPLLKDEDLPPLGDPGSAQQTAAGDHDSSAAPSATEVEFETSDDAQTTAPSSPF